MKQLAWPTASFHISFLCFQTQLEACLQAITFYRKSLLSFIYCIQSEVTSDSKDATHCYLRRAFRRDFHLYGSMPLTDDSGDLNGDKLLAEDLVYADTSDKGTEKKIK